MSQAPSSTPSEILPSNYNNIYISAESLFVWLGLGASFLLLHYDNTR